MNTLGHNHGPEPIAPEAPSPVELAEAVNILSGRGDVRPMESARKLEKLKLGLAECESIIQEYSLNYEMAEALRQDKAMRDIEAATAFQIRQRRAFKDKIAKLEGIAPILGLDTMDRQEPNAVPSKAPDDDCPCKEEKKKAAEPLEV